MAHVLERSDCGGIDGRGLLGEPGYGAAAV